jgi:DNA-binding SARP family transcriptional activator
LWTGDFVKAAEVIDTLLNLTLRKDVSVAPLPLVLLKTYEAMYHAFRGEHGACHAAAEKGLEIARTSGVNIMYSQLMTHAVAGALGKGDLCTAAKLLDDLKVSIQRTQRVIVAYYHYMKAWHAILAQETDAAFQHIKEALGLAEAIGFPFLEATVRVGAAQVQLQRGSFEEAREHLDIALGIGRAMNSRILEFMCLLTAAHCSLRTGKRRDGLISLRQALTIGKNNGYTFFLFWHPPTIASLCEEALDAGIEVAYVQDLIRRRSLVPPDAAAAPETWPWFITVRTFGSFEILREGKPVRFSGKVQQKPLALLKAIIVQGGRELGADHLMYTLWPDSEGDQAHKSCEITLHRLRKLLGEDKTIRLHEGKLALDPAYCRVDAWAFEKLFQEAEQKVRSEKKQEGKSTSDVRGPQSAIQLLEKAFALYRRPFLPADTGLSWTVSYRESLRSKFIRMVLILGDCLEKAGQQERAVECYQKGLDVDCLAEEFYQRLMLCYDRLGQQKEACAVYQRCRSVLSASLGLAPSARTEEIYRRVKGGSAGRQ